MTRFFLLAIGLVAAGVFFGTMAPAQRFSPMPPLSAAPVADVAPWANKLFLADIKKNPAQQPPRELEYDFGTVPHGTVASQKFIITNIYDVPLQVIDIRRECGCLTAYPPQKVLQPNEEAEFTVTMNTGIFRDAGEIRKTLYVTFGPNAVSTAVIRFKAVSRKDVAVTPGQVDFGIVAQGEKRSVTAVVKYTGVRRDWKVTGAVPPTGPIDVEVKEATRGFLTGAEYWLTVSLKPETPSGQLSETVVLKTNDPSVPTVNVTVLAQIQAPITVAPNKVDFKTVKLGSIEKHKVMLKAATAFSVQGLVDDVNGITIKGPLGAAAPVQVLEVMFEPKKAGRVSQVYKLRTNLGAGVTVSLPVEAEATP